MIVYSYDSDGFYIGEAEAQPNPVRDGEYLIPAMATATQPPMQTDTEEPQWSGSAWVMVTSRTELQRIAAEEAADAEAAEIAAREAEEAAAAAELAAEEAELANQALLDEVNEYGTHLYEADNEGQAVARDAQAIQDDNMVVIKVTQTAEAKALMDQAILEKAMEITHGTSSVSCQAFFSSYQNRVTFPADYASSGLQVYYASGTYALGDALDTEVKIVEYYKGLLIEMDTYRETKIAEYIAQKAVIDAL